ncbi:MAG TPA: cysteine--tRNA ligase [Firmicutes bacterium]|jgi:cysteinyl-tRNA synthetase|nr:cysteine--tRNA ligase [Bacillota bacterium]HBR33768.1 cysteine--tRNA ligase [Bacillota bacterium]
MAIQVYNTLTKQKEEFVPANPGKVGIYVCGVTPYNYAHIGNARPPVVWDCIRRFLRYRGYEVTLVQNFTDVDDKIILHAKQSGEDPLALSARFAQIYLEDMEALGVETATYYPKVSEHLPEIIEMVQGLVDKGHAYQVEGDVYFAVDSFADYGKLSGRPLEEMLSGARVEADQRKRNPMDFALWKAAKPGEPAWESPWGKGRPGWHIECSAMSLKYLDTGFDFHGGGSDLIFPHHENEIAQAEAYCGTKPFVRYWLHTAFITMSGDKMSKSLGNVVTIREACARFTPKAVRFWLLGTHYRNPLSFGEEELTAAAHGLARLETARDNWRHLLSTPVQADDEGAGVIPSIPELVASCRHRFIAALEDDFNTAMALGMLYDLVREVNKWALADDFVLTASRQELLAEALAVLEELGALLGIWFAEEPAATGLSDDEINSLVKQRQTARDNRDFNTADEIRDTLKAAGIVVEDTPQGMRWRRV